MADSYLIRHETLEDIADAIRYRRGHENGINAEDMADEIRSISGEGGVNTSDATATADEIFAGETAYTASGKVTGTFTIEPEINESLALVQEIAALVETKAAPSSGGINTSDATATANDILSGKTAYARGAKIVGSIASQSAAVITPGATSQVAVPRGVYTLGEITVAGDPNLVAHNIREGISIFGIEGTCSGSDDGPLAPGDGSNNTTSSTTVETIGISVPIRSTAAGNMIYAIVDTSGTIGYIKSTLNSAGSRYIATLTQEALTNSPIIVISSGTITFPTASGCTVTKIASGTGYAVYVVAKSSSGGSTSPDGPGGLDGPT